MACINVGVDRTNIIKILKTKADHLKKKEIEKAEEVAEKIDQMLRETSEEIEKPPELCFITF